MYGKIGLAIVICLFVLASAFQSREADKFYRAHKELVRIMYNHQVVELPRVEETEKIDITEFFFFGPGSAPPVEKIDLGTTITPSIHSLGSTEAYLQIRDYDNFGGERYQGELTVIVTGPFITSTSCRPYQLLTLTQADACRFVFKEGGSIQLWWNKETVNGAPHIIVKYRFNSRV